jgi:hypothetical protein
LNYHRIVAVIVVITLAASLILNLNFYLYTRAQNENVVNNMMTRALGSYSVQINLAEYFLNRYLDTKNRSLIQNEAALCAYGAAVSADVCRQSSSEEMYSQLWNTAIELRSFALYYVGFGFVINETKLIDAILAFDQIRQFFAGIEKANNENPIDYLTEVNGTNATATVIYYCQVVQDNLPSPPIH